MEKTYYSEDEFVMISALQHYLFCRRQCALIHLEQLWTENQLTAEGRVLHERVDRRESETRGTVHVATSLRLFSSQLGVTGIADMVEFHQTDHQQFLQGEIIAISLPRLPKFWIPYPVEYKHGKPKIHRADEVQLCAQAICLEEMLKCKILEGSLFYGKTRKRMVVNFDEKLRLLTFKTAKEVHLLIQTNLTPVGIYTKACESCSLFDLCNPKMSQISSVKKWISQQIKESDGAE